MCLASFLSLTATLKLKIIKININTSLFFDRANPRRGDQQVQRQSLLPPQQGGSQRPTDPRRKPINNVHSCLNLTIVKKNLINVQESLRDMSLKPNTKIYVHPGGWPNKNYKSSRVAGPFYKQLGNNNEGQEGPPDSQGLQNRIYQKLLSHSHTTTQGWGKALSNSLSLKHKHLKFFKHKHKHKHYPRIHDLS